MIGKPATRRLLLPAILLAAPAAAFASTGEGEADMTGRMMMLVIQLGLILFAAKLGNIFFEKIRLPGALGELLAGMAMGPFALGRLGFFGFPEGLFPLPGQGGSVLSPELSALAAVAAVVLLFQAGLETDLKLLIRYSLAGGLVGIGGMAASFFLGAGSVMVFSERLFGRPLGLFAPQCLLLGTITTATSVGITARILSERRKLDKPESTIILSAAVIDDVLGIILLAIVMSVVTASGGGAASVDWGHIAMIAAKAVGVWLAATVIGLLATRKISFLLKWFGERTSIAIMALGLALILAGLFEEAGLAMIIGAYVMGLSLSQADISRVVQEKLAPVYALLVPVFFCTTGMQINLAALTSGPVLVFGAVYALAALLAKVVGCGLPALLVNFNLRGAARIGFGMAPRCEVALIIAGVGLGAGILSPQILAAVIIMVVVNTVVAPAAMAALFRSSAPGTRTVPTPGASGASVDFELPTHEMADFLVGELASVFESEGFFVHQLNRQRLYQLRQDRTVIELRQAEQKLTFSCAAADVPLVNAAMHEALAGLEHTVRGLREPLDARSIQSRLQDFSGAGAANGSFHIRNYLSLDLIRRNLSGATKAQIIDEMLELLVGAGLVADVEAARQAVWERETSLSTGLQYGVAIPHGKTDAVDHLVCAVGLKVEGMDFEAMDGQPSRIFVLTLSPRSKPAPHVQFMSAISQVLNEEGRERLLSCRTRREIYETLTAPTAKARAARARPAAKRTAARFDMADYIRPDLVEPDLRGTTKQEIVHELLALLDRAGRLSDVQEAASVVLAREAQLSTAMEEGVAVPHGRTDATDRLVCAVGVKREGVDFGAADGEPTRIFILVLTPESGSDPYLQFVASLMNALDAEGRARILAAQSAQDICRALTGATRR